MCNVRTNPSSARRYATRLLLAVVVGAVPTAAPAQTETDSKILPATMCQVWGPFENNLSQATVSEIRNSIRYTENGRVENWHPVYKIAVVCPLVRDYVAGRLDALAVTFRDNYTGSGSNGRGILECTLLANNREGTRAVASHYQNSEGPNGDSADDDGVFDFEDMTLDDAATDGSFTLTCAIPPMYHEVKSFIGGIRYRER
jgi:hypothetical protein